MALMSLKRIRLGGLLALVTVTLMACSGAGKNVPAPDQVSMGNFALGHLAVVVEKPKQGPFSRNATDEELKAALEAGLQRRFGGYQGSKFYHVGVKLDLYALAVPGVPIVFSPQSVMVVTVSFWDDAKGKRLSEDGGKGMIVFERLTGETLISSGLTQSKQQQMRNLADNVAFKIQEWILENPQWIGLPPKPKAAVEKK